MKIALQKLNKKLKVSEKLDNDLLTKEVLEHFKCFHFFKAIKILNEGAVNKILFNMPIYEFIKRKLDFIEKSSF